MPEIDVKSADSVRFDEISLGEVMLRLDPGEQRIRTSRNFRVWEGGGEYNVARGLRRAFGYRTAIVTALVDNEVGRLVEDCILNGGVDTDLIRWLPFDGVGRDARNGLNFTERGFGVRGALGVSDRGNTAASLMEPRDVDWDHVFGELGARWFHTGGIFAALSESAAETTIAAVTAARRHGTIVSYDLNYRPSLWRAIGGQKRAQAVNREIAPLVDVMIGNEEDFTACLGFEVRGQKAQGSEVDGTEVDGTEPNLDRLETDAFAAMIDEVARAHPNLLVVATTLRGVRSATVNDWSALAWSRKSGLVASTERPGLEVLDRVGGGDSFASGLICGLLDGEDLATAVEYGAAHGALAMTTPGDTSMATREDVVRLAKGGGARVVR